MTWSPNDPRPNEVALALLTAFAHNDNELTSMLVGELRKDPTRSVNAARGLASVGAVLVRELAAARGCTEDDVLAWLGERVANEPYEGA
jgi:hypothetical protein